MSGPDAYELARRREQADRARRLSARDRALAAREREYEDLAQLQARTHDELEVQARRVMALEEAIATMRELLAEREDELLRCHRALAERDRAASELQQALADAERRISDMRSTRAWRAASTYWRLRERP